MNEFGYYLLLGGITLFLAGWAIFFAIQDRRDARSKNK